MENNENDNSLDDFIRKRLNQVNPKFEENAWSKMEFLLDEKTIVVRKVATQNSYAIVSVLVTLVLLGGIFYLKNFPNIRKTSKATTENAVVTKKKKYADKEVRQSLDAKTKSISKNKIEKSKVNKEQTFRHRKAKNIISSSGKRKVRKSIIAKSDIDKVLGEANTSIEKKPNTALLLVPKKLGISSLEFKTVLPDKLNFARHSLGFEPEVSKSKRNFREKLAFGFLANPEYQKVQFVEKHYFNLNLGLLARLDIFKNFQVQTGIILRENTYQPQNLETQSKVQSFTSTSLSSLKVLSSYQTQVSTTALEIPINVLYTFINKNRLSFFAGIGVSNYWVLNQKFEQDVIASRAVFDDISLVEARVDSEVTQNQFQAFGSLNMQLGLNYYINSKLYCSFSPYYKLSLSGIGIEEANINASGLEFAVFKKF